MYEQIILTGDFYGVTDLHKDKKAQKKINRKPKGKLPQVSYDVINKKI